MTEPVTSRRPRGRPTTSGRFTCGRCKRSTSKIRTSWPDGRICNSCFYTATRTFGDCHRCGQHRLLPGRDGDAMLCRSCAGITSDLDCHRCGTEGEPYRRGLCARCSLRDDLTELLLPRDQASQPDLVAFVDVLVGVDRPESIHTWKRNPQVVALLRGLGEGSITLEHASFDAAPAGISREHIRALLVHHQLLPDRDPHLTRFEHWLQQKLACIPDQAVRHPLEQFCTWHHLRRMRRKSGQDLHASVHSSKQEITETSKFLLWLAEHDRTIGTCRQTDLDQWLAEGPTTRYLIRTFIVWASKQGLCSELTIGFRQARSVRLVTQDDRLTWLSRLLVGDTETLPYRVAGILMLLYAQPLVRIVGLRTDRVHVTPTEIRILLGSEATAVPEPFAGLLRDHLASRPNMRTANSSGNPWLFPSTRAGYHLHPNTLMKRLRNLGVDLLGARNAALRDLVQRVPAPIVATQLGYSPQVTQRHADHAAQPMSRYAALKAYEQ